jgi:hypothetical protein
MFTLRQSGTYYSLLNDSQCQILLYHYSHTSLEVSSLLPTRWGVVRWGEVRWGEVTLQLTVIHPVSMSWYRAPLWDLRPDITSCPNVAVWNFRSWPTAFAFLFQAHNPNNYKMALMSAPLQAIASNPHTKSKLLCDWQSVSRYVLVEVEVTLRLTVSQLVCLGTEYPCGTCNQTRGRVCNFQCNHSIVRAAKNPKPYFTVSSETPPTWRARFPYLYPPRTGWPSYTPGHWVLFT